MNQRLFLSTSNILFRLTLIGLAFAAAALVLRNGLAIAVHVPLDPDEGWNAYLARAAVSGAPLYPHGLMVNNYPPLSFYIVGMLGRITGDPIVAGRLLSLIAFSASTGTIIAILREMGAGVLAALFGALFFATGLLAASDYVAMNDPQLLGHALQLAGLFLLLPGRRATTSAALLMAAGLFVKHDLIVLPLAASLWLVLEDPKAALRFAGVGLAAGIAGLITAKLLIGVNLIEAVSSPRQWKAVNFAAGAEGFLIWAGAALLTAAGLAWRRWRDPHVRLVTLYAAIALVTGGVFAFGDGVDANIFFDAAIALGLGAGVALREVPRRWLGPLALFAAAPLVLYMFRNITDAGFHYTAAFAREAPLDIAFLRVHAGPALCEDLTLCFWADKDMPVDVFNLSEAIATGVRSDRDLAHLLATQYFSSIALSRLTPFALGPHLKSVLLAHYRAVRQDDNGVFLERR
jgi:hypothetical protein